MKTIIIDLPPNVNPTEAADAIADVAHNIGRGDIVLVPPFHYNIDTSTGIVTVRSEAEPDNQAHPPLGTTLANFTAAMLDALPVGSRFGPTSEFGHVVTKRADGVWCGETVSPFEEDSANLLRLWADDDPPLTLNPIRVGPEQATEPAPSATLPDPEPVREPLPFPVRRYGSCRTWNQPDGEGRFDVGYEFFGCAAGPRDVSESRTFDTEAEGHAWLLSVMVDPGPLPDPWPKMMLEYATDTLGWARGTVAYACADPDGPTYVLLETDNPNDPDDGIEWCADNIREVRTPDGVTLWKRPAGGAS